MSAMARAVTGNCSFCGKDGKEARALVGAATTDAQICDHCLALACRVLAEAAGISGESQSPDIALDDSPERLAAILSALATKGPPQQVLAPELPCSFCAKRRADVPCLVVGPRVTICDACVGGAIALVRSA